MMQRLRLLVLHGAHLQCRISLICFQLAVCHINLVTISILQLVETNKTTCFYWTSERVNDYNSDTWNEGAYMTISQQLIAFGHTIRPVSD